MDSLRTLDRSNFSISQAVPNNLNLDQQAKNSMDDSINRNGMLHVADIVPLNNKNLICDVVRRSIRIS